jgi:hypothetical protein
MKPCKTTRAGRLVGDFCDDCPHQLIVHRQDFVCELCQIREDLGLAPAKKS